MIACECKALDSVSQEALSSPMFLNSSSSLSLVKASWGWCSCSCLCFLLIWWCLNQTDLVVCQTVGEDAEKSHINFKNVLLIAIFSLVPKCVPYKNHADMPTLEATKDLWFSFSSNFRQNFWECQECCSYSSSNIALKTEFSGKNGLKLHIQWFLNDSIF